MRSFARACAWRAWRRRAPFAILLSVALLLSGALPLLRHARAASAPPHFQVQPVISGLHSPTDFAFASDGRLFVAERSGIIKVFDSLADTTPSIFADLREEVYTGPNDHGLLGLALPPDFPSDPHVYVLYTYDAPIGEAAPRWNDVCPDPPGATKNGCVVSGRLSRLLADGDQMEGDEQVLIEDWCQQFTSHSIGALAFGEDGALYASAGEGASTTSGDFGHVGFTNPISYTSITPANPCGDPPVPVGAKQTPPTAEGGALRSQDLRTPGDPVGLSGSVIRVDPATGVGLPDNPLAGDVDANTRRIIAYGMRNPFRFALRPGTRELWVGDVGWSKWEEIDKIADVSDATVENFGWPCYEGALHQQTYDGFNLKICEQLYQADGAATAPFYAYAHSSPMLPDETCTPQAVCDSAISGLAFYQGSIYPAAYRGALFFADYAREAIWVMFKGADGQPDPSMVTPFVTAAGAPVSLKAGPDGDLFYADITGTIYRITFFPNNEPPVATIQSDVSSGVAPLTVAFDATGSSDADGDALSYAWDLDGDGQYDDSAEPKPVHTFHMAGDYTVGLSVTDSLGAFADASLLISAGNTPPTAVIDTPMDGQKWGVGDTISFSGHASDAQQGMLPESALVWQVLLHHCYDASNCHVHPMEELQGVGGGSFVAPDHEDLPQIELRLTATDAGGLSSTASVLLPPYTTSMQLRSQPPGMLITIDNRDVTAPVSQTVVVGSQHMLLAAEQQQHRSFAGWTDSPDRIRTTLLGSAPVTYTVVYSNHVPLASAIAAPMSGLAPLAVTFSGVHSFDDEDQALIYDWDFGDGATASGVTVKHTFTQAGARQVTLTVTDALGATRQAYISVSVLAPSSERFYVWLPLLRR